MKRSPGIRIDRLAPGDLELMDGLLSMFGAAVNEVDTYGRNRPDAGYLQKLLGSDAFVALAAVRDGEVIGGRRTTATTLPLRCMRSLVLAKKCCTSTSR